MKAREVRADAPTIFRWGWTLVFISILTVLTQIGGVAWLSASLFRRRLIAFAGIYAALACLAYWVAPVFGREPISCLGQAPLRMQNPLYCAMNRNYVTPRMKRVATDLARDMSERHPGTITLALDGSFPFVTGFPLLPHLSHDDGRKLDFAFYYRDDTRYLPGKTRSPLGYFAFEDGPTACPDTRLTLRWNLAFLQSLWPVYSLDTSRTRHMLHLLARDDRVDKIFIEPHLRDRLGVRSSKIRFQGCRAGRHDDHIHIQL